MKVHCFFHRADLDGHCSGAIVRRWCNKNGHEYIPHGVNYGETVDWFCGNAEDMAVLVDFTPEGDADAQLLKMEERYNKLVWIDHHETALKGVKDRRYKIEGLRTSGVAACILTWRYFFGGRIPATVMWLGRYDVFDRSISEEWEHVILPFQYGLKIRSTKPDGSDEKDLWNKLLDKTNKEWGPIIMNGRTCLDYARSNNRRMALSFGYDCFFFNLLCCAINAPGDDLLLEAYARPEHAMRIVWYYRRGKWKVSLRGNGRDDVHCGMVAKRYGGGGHLDSAAFLMERCPLDYGLFIPLPKEGEVVT